jgi:hypothetical protein
VEIDLVVGAKEQDYAMNGPLITLPQERYLMEIFYGGVLRYGSRARNTLTALETLGYVKVASRRGVVLEASLTDIGYRQSVRQILSRVGPSLRSQFADGLIEVGS